MAAALPSEARNIRSRMRSADTVSKLVVLTMEIDAMYETELLVTSSRKAVKGGKASAEQYTRSKTAAKSKIIQKSDRLITAAKEVDRKGGDVAKNAGIDRAKVELLDVFESELRSLIADR